RHHGRGRERRGQDDVDREARLAVEEPDEQEGDGRRLRYVPRRGGRSVDDLGGPDWRRDREAQERRRSRGGRVRRVRGGEDARDRRAHRRYRRTAAYAGSPDARADEDP